jgi:replication initiation protein RepC
MNIIETYNPPLSGGRISSPKIRGADQFSDEFEGLAEDAKRFELLKLVKRVGAYAGFTSKMVQLLEYYLVFTKDCDWKAGNRPIVYQALSKTALDFGVSERQIQKLEKALFEIGALAWNDSGNHRRYGTRDAETGEIVYAYGVDLSPLAALRTFLIAKDSEKRLADEAWMETKRQISWYRSQIRSMVAEAREVRTLEHFSIQAESNYEGIAISIRTYMDIKDLRTLLEAHKDLYDVLMNTLEGTSPALKEAQLSHEYTSKDEQQFAHIDNTNKTKYDKSYNSSSKSIEASEGSVVDPRSSKPHNDAPVTLSKGEISDSKEQWRAAISEELGRISWKQVLNACSDRFKQQFPIHDRPLAWSDIVDAAAGMLPTLGISKSAWWEACGTLGRHGAAICIMVIDQKTQAADLADRVRNPGGYLREMTARAKKGELNLHGSVFGLLKRGEGEHDA